MDNFFLFGCVYFWLLLSRAELGLGVDGVGVQRGYMNCKMGVLTIQAVNIAVGRNGEFACF